MATCCSCIKCLKSTCEIVSYCIQWLKFCNLYTLFYIRTIKFVESKMGTQGKLLGTNQQPRETTGESQGKHGGIMGEPQGNHMEIGETPLTQSPTPTTSHVRKLLRSAVTAFQSAVQNLPREVDVKARVGFSMDIVRLAMRHHLFLEF